MAYLDFNKGNVVNVWDGIKGPIIHSDKITFGYFTLDEGVDLPEHSHPHEQWSHVIEGNLEFNIEGKVTILNPGMCALVPSNALHSGKALTKCRVIDCFLPVREDFIELEKQQYGS